LDCRFGEEGGVKKQFNFVFVIPDPEGVYIKKFIRPKYYFWDFRPRNRRITPADSSFNNQTDESVVRMAGLNVYETFSPAILTTGAASIC